MMAAEYRSQSIHISGESRAGNTEKEESNGGKLSAMERFDAVQPNPRGVWQCQDSAERQLVTFW